VHALPNLRRPTSRTALRAAGVVALAALTLPVVSVTSAFAAADVEQVAAAGEQLAPAPVVIEEVAVEAVAEQVVPEPEVVPAAAEEPAVEPAEEPVETQLAPAPAPVTVPAGDEPVVEVGPAVVLQAPVQAATAAELVAGIAGPASLTAGQTATWTLSVRNTGTRPAAHGVTLRPVLPPGVGVASAAAGDGLSCALEPLVCRLDGPLAAGGSASQVRLELAFSPAMSGVQAVGTAVSPAEGDPADTGVAHSASMPVTVYDALPEEPEAPADAGAAGSPASDAVVLAAPSTALTAAAPAVQAPAQAAAPATRAVRPARVVRAASASTAPRLTTVPRSTRTSRTAASAAAAPAAAAAGGAPTTLAFTGDRTDVALPAALALLALGAGLVRAGRRRPVVAGS